MTNIYAKGSYDMFKVYVAGSYDAGDVVSVLDNMRIGMRACTELLLENISPFCPWLDFHFQLMLRDDEKLTKQNFLDYSMAWLEVSDAVLVLPNSENSGGTQKEIKRADELNIPVFYSKDSLFFHLEKLHMEERT